MQPNNISIRNKLILMQVFTSLIVLGLCFGIFIITDIRSYKLRKENDLLSLAQLLGTSNISAIEFQDNEAANASLADLQHMSDDIVHATIADKNGKLFARYKKPGVQIGEIPPSLSRRKSLFTDNRFYVASNIVSGNEVIGRIYIESELSELALIRRNKIEIAGILLVAAIILSFLIAVVIQTYISRRLLNLVNTMQNVSSTGNYDQKIANSGKDEISILVKEFNHLLEEVKLNQQRKDEFIGIASHELKTPLTSVKGYTELLNMIEDKQPNKQYVQKVLQNVIKLEKLIQDLLDVSKIQSGQLELTMKEFDVDQLIDETINSVQMITGTHSITRETTSGNVTISGDRQRIEQVLTNLLSNAIKYSPGENKVSVSSSKTDKEVIIKIRDYGMGVAKDERQTIFERFYRAKGTSITISGFGLGLYICRDIIKRHKGNIWVEEEGEKGSAFYFSLPLEQNGRIH
ncbi:MAG TPA: ATP-binding protein [Chitinophagaceae bacterium]|nr:ATP-binding protein [Chitinophagaceae bacterium]